MKAAFLALAVSALLIVSFALSALSNSEPQDNPLNNKSADMKEPEKPQILLGYCPTMRAEAENIAKKNEGISIVEYRYANEVLGKLENSEIEIALIGRKAYPCEALDSYERRIGEGLTLAGDQKRLVDISEIASMNIHTAIEYNIASDFIPEAKNLVYHQTLEEAESAGLNEALLVDWKDFKPTYQLIIPMEGLAKSKKFRAPHLYSLNPKISEIEL
jgi:hypothetical protein